ncbi:MAG: 5'/3'-nucleotidase SurE [Anaerovoracaceae bacterium]|jgi:5'-nucleotidase
MNILVVNDDGIRSRGLTELVRALSMVADVFVCAPETQQSGKSQAITIGLHNFIRIRETAVPFAVKSYMTDGTPADCTKVGLQFFREEGFPIDMVFSGINIGGNTGEDTLYSGTVGAAKEAAITGVRAVAVSVDNFRVRNFEPACRLAVRLIPYSMKHLTPDTILNLNVPDLPMEEIRGVRTTKLGGRFYLDQFNLKDDELYMLEGAPVDLDGVDRELDIAATADGYASITPIHVDNTQYELLEEVSSWDLTL